MKKRVAALPETDGREPLAQRAGSRPAGLELSTPGLEGKPHVPDAVFFSVGCGFTHANSPRVCRHISSGRAADAASFSSDSRHGA